MPRRMTSLSNIADLAVSREIDSKYDIVKQVAAKLPEIEQIGEDIDGLITSLNAALDFTGITVVGGEVGEWNPTTKVLTVPTVKGDTGATGVAGADGLNGIQGIQGEAGNGVSTIIKTGTVGLVDTYTITFTDTTTTTFDVTNGLNGTNGVDGQDIEHVSKTSGTGAAGTTDIYTVWGDIGETINLGTFNVYNGADGVGVGDMLKATYDTTNNGVVDNAELVNGLTVETAVPVGAVFTDTVYDPAAIETLTNKTLDSIDNWIGANHIHYNVKAVEDLPAGVIVMGVGYNSGEDVFEVAKWTVASGKPALGMNHHALLNGEIGFIVQSGQIKDIDTSLLTVGVVYYPADNGLLTTIKPTTGSYQAAVYVLRSHSSQGAVTVNFAAPIAIASTAQEGYVQLNDTLTSTSTTEALTAAQGKALQDGKQPIDATLTALAGVTVAEDKLIYATGVDTFGTTTISAYGRSILDDVDAETARSTLGLTIGTNVQAYDAGLQSIAGLTTLADRMIYTTASDTYAVTSITSAGRSLIDDVDFATMRNTLEISAANTPSTAVGGITATNVQAAIQELDSKKANLASPVLTGVPEAPTAAVGTNTTQLATTAFVNAEIANDAVLLTSNQTIAGIKTFSSPIELANSGFNATLQSGTLSENVVHTLPSTSSNLASEQYVLDNGFTVASTAEAQAGTNNTNGITPLRLREALNATGTAPIYACRAWVNFNGTGTVAIRASGNVSSITDNAVGDYTVNFTVAMSDIDYTCAGMAVFGNDTVDNTDSLVVPYRPNTYTPSTSSFRVRTGSVGGTNADSRRVQLVFNR